MIDLNNMRLLILFDLFFPRFLPFKRDTLEYYSVVMARNCLAVHCSWWCKDGLSCVPWCLHFQELS